MANNRRIFINGTIRTVKSDHDMDTVVQRYRSLGFRAFANPPTIETVQRWDYDGEMKATDGCHVESDSQCPHGCNSWLVEFGLI